MPLFEYRGTDKTGKSVKGNVDADNLRMARAKLKKDGIFVESLRDRQKVNSKNKLAAKPNTNKTVGVQDMSLMTRQLATLIKSSIPLVECLNALTDQVENPVLREVVADLKNQVNEGQSLFKSMSKYPKIFDNVYLSMVDAGESSGALDVILLRLAEFTESQNELRNKVRSAMMYPVLMLIFTLGMLMVMFVYIIPKITAVFDQFPELKLPWYSEVVIGFSGIMVEYWQAILILMIASFMIFKSWKATPNGKAQWDAFILKVPLVGKLTRMIAVSRFTKTLSTLLAGGVPMLTSMDIVKNVVGNHVLEQAVIAARDNISEGETISGPLKKSGEFPPIVIHMISIGEKTGELEQMLTQISESFDFQVKNTVEGLTSLLEPIMIVFMGGIVGLIVFAVMMPIMELSNIGGKG